ncbi:LamG-like jellyroll fold domain-containing protein [Plantactinospora sp. CA-294935]|uniref:LamG-like jellyroll fold domain-containing protein n=1 Tax=Plantactinospora sp. CA-294935 TaxID=3240012 RepID=UPI003D8DCBC6
MVVAPAGPAAASPTQDRFERSNHSVPRLAIGRNADPNVLADPKSDGKPCATGAARPYVLTTTPVLAGRQSDPDTGQQSLTTWFYWWPLGDSRNEVDKVSQASGNPSTVSQAIPSGKLVDGGTYAWQARTHDGSRYGAWSGVCEFTVDVTPPPMPGNVTSTDYPDDGAHGAVGWPGVFEIAPPEVDPHEVEAYAWTFDSGTLPTTTIPARSTDHGATLTVAPPRDGINMLRVWSMDRAGRFSTQARIYTFSVRAPWGPAGHWTFEETGGDAVDVSGHGNTAALDASADRVPGRSGVGTALALDGSAAGTVSGPVTLTRPGESTVVPVRTDADFTVAAWARITSPAGPAEQVVLAGNGTRTFAYSLSYAGNVERWRFSMTGADTDDPAGYSVTSDAAAVPEKWTHLAGVYEAATRTLTLYVDGVAQSTTTTLAGGFGATTDTTIGKRRWNGGDQGFFTGAVDDVRLYDYPETPAKLAGLAVPLPPAIAFPGGAVADAGGQLTVVFDARGDTNVTRFRYSVGDAGLGTEVAATEPGGTATVTFDVGSLYGDRSVYAVAVDGGNRVSGLARGEFTVIGQPYLTGTVIDVETFMPVPGATVRLEPGGVESTTGPDGAYSFTGIPAGTYTVSTSHEGRCAGVTIDVPPSGTYFDLYLLPCPGGGRG